MALQRRTLYSRRTSEIIQTFSQKYWNFTLRPEQKLRMSRMAKEFLEKYRRESVRCFPLRYCKRHRLPTSPVQKPLI